MLHPCKLTVGRLFSGWTSAGDNAVPHRPLPTWDVCQGYSSNPCFSLNPELHQFAMSVCNAIYCLDSMYSDSALPTVHWFSPNTTVPCAILFYTEAQP